jgi:MerR family transcriptional regulator, light-induced transcriptional regulator
VELPVEARRDGRPVTEPPTPTLTVAAVARRLGVAPATLRTWDRRYGLGPSGHTAGSHRRYTPADVACLVVMRRLTLDGVPPADAARIARSEAAGSPLTAGQGDLAAPEPRGEEAAGGSGAYGTLHMLEGGEPTRPRWSALDPSIEEDEALAPADTWPPVVLQPGRAPGGGRVMALPRGTPQTRGLARAAMSLDTDECHRLLVTAMRDQGVVGTWQGLVLPVLNAIGERWQASGEGVDVEHLFSEVLLGLLRSVAATLRRPQNARPVMIGCAEGDYHTLPVHALAAALAERGISTRVFGVGMPATHLISAVRRSGPAGVVMYAQLQVSDSSVLAQLRRLRPAPRLIVGGPGWEEIDLPSFAHRASSLAEAVDEAIRSLHL